MFTPSHSLQTLLSTATFGWHWDLDVCLYCHNTGRWPVWWHRHRLFQFFDASTRFGKCGQVGLGREETVETVAIAVFPLWKDTFESYFAVIRVYAVASSNKFNKEERCTQESRPCGAQPFLEGRRHRKALIISLQFMFTGKRWRVSHAQSRVLDPLQRRVLKPDRHQRYSESPFEWCLTKSQICIALSWNDSNRTHLKVPCVSVRRWSRCSCEVICSKEKALDLIAIWQHFVMLSNNSDKYCALIIGVRKLNLRSVLMTLICHSVASSVG